MLESVRPFVCQELLSLQFHERNSKASYENAKFYATKKFAKICAYQLIKLRNYCLINDSPKLAFIFLEFFIR